MKEVRLNKAQQEAVDHIYGPLLVLAGPGTGKTQLLSARIANILQKTDTSAHNILCLTFTDNAATNMRERLSQTIGPLAFDIHIGTYHSFGSDIIRAYPDYFETTNLITGEDTRLERPIDELEQFQIITDIIAKLPYSSPLIGAKHYPKQLVSIIGDLKKASLSPDDLESIAQQNLKDCHTFSPIVEDVLGNLVRMPSKVDVSIATFTPIYEALSKATGSLASEAASELDKAMQDAREIGKSTPITAWKDDWVTKDEQGKRIFTSIDMHLRMAELATIYRTYNNVLRTRNLYDYDDMILRVNQALKDHPDLKYNLQEKYQFILLDEFQDTNRAQFNLVELLADNPVLENEPNLFAVGDDDQAIYAFQGAELDNMKRFAEIYSNVKVINLTENYRSHKDILHVAHGISSQIEKRLHHQLEDIAKTLSAESTELPENATIERHEFSGVADEYAWIAKKISELIKSGVPAKEIAILSPQHKFLEALVPFLADSKVPISYDKREDILSTPIVTMLSTICELLVAISRSDMVKMNELFPVVLSYDFYEVPIEKIWRTNWKLYRNKESSWVELGIEQPELKDHIEAFLKLGLKAKDEPLEYMLDYIIGVQHITLDKETTYTSPFRDYYFSDRHTNPLEFYESLTHLSTIREHLRNWQHQEDSVLRLEDFLRYIVLYKQSEQPLINSHPISQSDSAVELMTIYKAKGLEFEFVFLLSLDDSIWGKSSRSQAHKISLPKNLSYIRYKGSDEDELKRLLFVAITRAKHGLVLTSHAQKDNGKLTTPVKYLHEYDGEKDTRYSTLLPTNYQAIKVQETTAIESLRAVDLLWHSRHITIDASLKSLLKTSLERYQMSPTHLNTFIDLEYGGPESFLEHTLLRFPSAPGEDGEYGNAIHGALERLQKHDSKNLGTLQAQFEYLIGTSYMPESRKTHFKERGLNSLRAYYDARKTMLEEPAEIEIDFYKNHIVLDSKVRISGKIDRLEVDHKARTLKVVDFKTGKGYARWEKELKLLKYRQQLYFYIILLENSVDWKGYTIESARLEFVDPSASGKILDPLVLDYDEKEKAELIKLLHAMWEKVQSLDFPDVSAYEQSYKGATSFITALIEG